MIALGIFYQLNSWVMSHVQSLVSSIKFHGIYWNITKRFQEISTSVPFSDYVESERVLWGNGKDGSLLESLT